jgi:hypothetical protein
MHNSELVHTHSRSSRCVEADYPRSASTDTSVAAKAEEEADGVKIKAEQKPHFMPELMPSKHGALARGPSRSPVVSLLTEASTVSISPPSTISPALPISEPFSFGEEPYSDPPHFHPPLSSFIQSSWGDARVHSSQISKGSTECLGPAAVESSKEGPPPSKFIRGAGEAVTSHLFYSHPVQPQASKSFTEYLSGARVKTRAPSRSSSVSPPASLQFSAANTDDACHCLNVRTAFNPLVQFAIALRNSREALEELHSSATDCHFFRHIVELEDHILYANSDQNLSGSILIYDLASVRHRLLRPRSPNSSLSFTNMAAALSILHWHQDRPSDPPL